MVQKNVNKVVLAYSGGLDTSVALRWLKETYNCQVIAFIADIGQNEPLSRIRDKAVATGAKKAYVEDLKEEFVREYVFPAFRANAIYEGDYLLSTALARPLIARRQITIAEKEKACAVSHGATGKGNDQVRFELSFMALNPNIKIIAPWREWDFKSRSQLIAYARKKGIPLSVTKEKPYSIDRNLLHASFEGGILEDPWKEPPEDMFKMTVSPEHAPDKPSYIEIRFERGDPVAINGKKMPPVRLLSSLNRIGGQHGIGRVDMVENRYIGMKSRGVYETPGGTIWRIAHRAVESITLDREVMRIRDSLIPRYSELIYYGYWFSPEMQLMQRIMDEAQANVSGTARLKLYKGNCMVAGRKSHRSLYQRDVATFEEDEIYRHRDAEGFICLNALRLKIMARLKEGV
jgi:argininosuccinate synthase